MPHGEMMRTAEQQDQLFSARRHWGCQRCPIPSLLRFPSFTSWKREWECSPTGHGGGVRCSSSLRWDTQAIYSSRECKQTHPCPSVPISCPLPALALGHLVPAGGQATRPHCHRLGTDGQAPAGTGGRGLGTIPGTPLLRKPKRLQGVESDPSPALRT